MHAMKRLSTTAIFTMLTTLLGIVVAGCSEAPPETKVVTLEATEFAFEPQRIEAEPGQTLRIRLVNQGAVSHNLHIADAKVGSETIQTDGSDTFEFTAPESGEVRFFCNVPGHEQAGMTGTIVVTED